MRFPFRAIVIGVLIGAALFFAPFGFPFFILPLLLIVILSKALFFGRFSHRGYGHYRGYGYHDEVMPIDGYGSAQSWREKGQERDIPVN